VQIIAMIKADPPALMNGSGIPFVGSIPTKGMPLPWSDS